MKKTPRIVITPGDPAGIGLDLVIQLSLLPQTTEWVIIADPSAVQERVNALGASVQLNVLDNKLDTLQNQQSVLNILPIKYLAPVVPGQPSYDNNASIIESIDRATAGCLSGDFTAMVTGPVNKNTINQSGIEFTGHTEHIAALCGADLPVMMLVGDQLRVALATTHLPIAKVASAITRTHLKQVMQIILRDLSLWYGISAPHLKVCGLNPHAGDGGCIGTEELEVIIPAIQDLQQQGHQITGPCSADTIFLPKQLEGVDAVLCMFHDQGLPVLKYASFGTAVNVTLGLPIIRTSVDHGTAYDMAASGQADVGSLQAAVSLASQLATRCTTSE